MSAEAITRAFRLRPATRVPDLTDQILTKAHIPRKRVLPSIRLRISGRKARIALAVIALLQTAIGIAQLAGVSLPTTGGQHAHGEQAHTVSEGSAWALAIGLGLLVAAWRTQTARGMLPIVTTFVVAILAITTRDLIAGEVSFAHVSDHLVLLAGLVLLFVVYRQDRTSGTPFPTAAMSDPAQDWHSQYPGIGGVAGHYERGMGRHLRPASHRRAA